MRRWLTASAVALACLFLFGIEAEAGYRGPFEGRVVDAETRQPIQGAVAFVEWNLGHVTVAGRVDTFYDAAEVLTDEQGHFRIKKKWSWNPWTNWMLNARVIIFKGGYGSVSSVSALPPAWRRSDLERVAAFMKARTEEERKRVGPSFYFDIEFEDDLPVFLLRKLTTTEERRSNLPHVSVPEQKMELLQDEKNRERKLIGLD